MISLFYSCWSLGPPHRSSTFDKTVLHIAGAVFVDATEFGDVLVTGAAARGLRLPVMQGVAAWGAENRLE